MKEKRKAEIIVKNIYSRNVLREWNRLIKSPYHRLEFETSLYFLKKYLPKKGLILDAGGGPGRYTIELAKNGYVVILLDLTPENLTFAKKQIKIAKLENKVKAYVEGPISDLSEFKDNTFDAVVCLGSPLSHIKNKRKREIAILELIRVAKRGAPVFISVMGKLGYLMRSINTWISEMEMDKRFMNIFVKGDDTSWGGKGYFHYFTLEELENLTKNKSAVLEKVGLEGLGGASEKTMNRLYKNKLAWNNWTKMHYHLCTHPSVVDVSPHILIVCKKL